MHGKLVALIILASIFSVIIALFLKKRFKTKFQFRKKENNSDWPDNDLKKVKIIKLNSCQCSIQQNHSESTTNCNCGHSLIIGDKLNNRNDCHESHSHHCHHGENHGEKYNNYQKNHVTTWLIPVFILACFCCFAHIRKCISRI